jgi:hypothetical protein
VVDIIVRATCEMFHKTIIPFSQSGRYNC